MTKFTSVCKSVVGLYLISCTQLSQAADMINITASAGLMLDDNLTRAQYSRDIYDDRAWIFGVAADYSLPLNQRSRTQLSANIETVRYQDSNLDHHILSLQATYFYQPGGGYTTPWYSASLLYGLNAYDNTYRDGTHSELGFNVGKRITDATSFRAGVSLNQTSADNDIFSLSSTRLYGNLDFKFAQSTVYTTLAYTSGDINSTNTPPHPAALDYYPWVNDDAAFPGLTNTWTYKLDADTWSIRLGYVHAITSNQSIDASMMHYASSAYGGNDYDGIITTILYFYRF